MVSCPCCLLFGGPESYRIRQSSFSGEHYSADVSAKLTDKILSTVHPRPIFEIAAIPTGSAQKFVVVIRVREGTFPPYEYVQGATVKIPVRIGDTDRQATVREFEALLGKRGSVGATPAEVSSAYIASSDLYSTDDVVGGPSTGNEVRSPNFHKVVAVPRSKDSVRLDIKFERSFERFVQKSFPRDRQFSRNFRRAVFYQTERRVQAKERTHRIWRVWSDGALGFVTSLAHPGGEPIGDVAADMIFFLRLAQAFFSERQYFGAVVISDTIACPIQKFQAKFPPPDGTHDYDMVDGIHLPDVRPNVLPSTSTWTEELSIEVLARPEEFVASILLGQLQETWGASINFDHLVEATSRLSKQSLAQGWGTHWR